MCVGGVSRWREKEAEEGKGKGKGKGYNGAVVPADPPPFELGSYLCCPVWSLIPRPN